MLHDRLFLHGAGRRGAAAWPPLGGGRGNEFVAFAPDSAILDQIGQVRAAVRGRPTIVYAHSIGAVPAVLAASHVDTAGLVLVEPALYDIVRGDPAAERHIGIVTEARAQAERGDLRSFWAMMRPLMFGGPFDPESWDAEQALAARWSTMNLPWGHGVRPAMIERIPTLVVTGGWNAEYEAIAARLVDHGASHEVLAGHAHRPQDSAGFPAVIESFEASLGG